MSDTGVAKNTRFDALMLSALKTPLKLVHPRRSNRTETMWNSAICIKADTKLPDAFNTLITENILSAVVLSPSDGKPIGFVDMMDLVTFTVNLYGAIPSEMELQEFFAKSKRFREVTVSEVLDLSEKSLWRPITIPRDFSLYGAIETIARTPDSHRVAIIHPKQHSVVGVVTESMIIGWLYVNLDKFGSTKNLPCSEITRSYFVASIEETEPAIKAFKIMADRKLSGLAVVNKMGLLRDTISVRDLKGIGPDAELFTRLWDSVAGFKAKIRKTGMHAHSIPKEPLYVVESDTLETVIKVMETEAIHRVWVVKSTTDLRPVNVISQSDVIRFILPY